jgi:hypothetical protein
MKAEGVGAHPFEWQTEDVSTAESLVPKMPRTVRTTFLNMMSEPPLLLRRVRSGTGVWDHSFRREWKHTLEIGDYMSGDNHWCDGITKEQALAADGLG